MAAPNERAPAHADSAARQYDKRREDGPTEPRAFDGDLGVGTPANVDIHKLGQPDHPEQAWGEPADPEATFGSNHTRRPAATEADRGQGAKTRRANKDIVSRRS